MDNSKNKNYVISDVLHIEVKSINDIINEVINKAINEVINGIYGIIDTVIDKNETEDKYPICNEVEEIDKCPICFDNLSNDIKILNCGHTFHKSCIDYWVKINPTCPYCRKYINNFFNCTLINKFIYKKCKIFLDENKFSKIIINIYSLFGKLIKQYIIPTTFIKIIERKNNLCEFYFKKTTNSKIKKYTFKFNNNNITSIFTYEINNVFKKYLEFYKSIQNINH